MSQLHKLQQDKQSIIEALKIPGLDKFETDTYKKTLDRINEQLQKYQQPSDTQQAQPKSKPVSEFNPNLRAKRLNIATVTKSETQLVKSGEITPFASIIKIVWDGEPDPKFYTEGQVRSRFITCCSDILESSLWKQRRYDDASKYMAWQRGVVYYQALTQLWGRAPSMKDLEMNRSRYETIFNQITNNNQDEETD